MPLIASILTAVFQLFMSRAGQLALAFAVGWTWSWWRTDAHWRAVIAAEKVKIEAQYQAELARQAQAAVDIARDATARVEAETAYNADLKAILEQYADEEAKQTPAPGKVIVRDNCVVDDSLIGVVRKLSAATSKAKPSRPAAKLRKAR